MKNNLLKVLTFVAISIGCTAGAYANDYTTYNSTTMVTPIAAQLGGYLVQLNSYDQAFQNMDMYMLSPQKVRKSKLAKKLRKNAKYVENNEFETTDVNNAAGVWVRPYGTIENVDLHNGPNAKNHLYGAYFGGESEMKDLGNDWTGKWGVYAGYNGSHQAALGNRILENGGTFGLVGMAYKDNFFVGGTVNVGASAGEAYHNQGLSNCDTFAMLMTGAAIKTGYNWELADGKFIVQPALQASYSFVNTFDKASGNGSRMDSNPLNAIQIEPGIKFIGNLNNGWQPYAGVNFVYTIMDRTHFWTNGMSMPSFSLNPYIKYGFGARKIWGERFSGFAQMYFMNCGRSGLAMTGGLQYALGKEGAYNVSHKADPKMENTKVTFNYKK